MNQKILTSTFIKFRDTLRNVAAGIVGDRDDAEDVIHDVFCRLWSKHPDVDNQPSAFRLTYTAVRNSAVDSLRRQRSHPSVSFDNPESNLTGIDEDSSSTDDAKGVYEAVIALSRRVLSQRQYEIFRMHDILGMTYEDVAEEMSMTVENVRVSVSRARKTIREIYRKQEKE